jgi:hypothetical protein
MDNERVQSDEEEPTPIPVPPADEAPSSTGLVIEDDTNEEPSGT